MDPSVSIFNFKEDQCDILMGCNLEPRAFKTAVAFVPSMRMKSWKPGKNAGGNSNGTFCYIDTTENNWFPSTNACIDGTVFGYSVPFIKRSFIDNKLDNTDTFPTEKCVFEIDRSKVTDTNLNPFWKKINDLDCIGQFKDYQSSNLLLSNNIETLKKNIKEIERKNADILYIIYALSNTLYDKTIEYADVTQKINIENTSNETLKTEKRLLETSIESKNSSFLTNYKTFSKQIISLFTNYNTYSNLIYKQIETQNSLDTDIILLNRRIREIKNDYDTTYQNYDATYSNYTKTYDCNLTIASNASYLEGQYVAYSNNYNNSLIVQKQLQNEIYALDILYKSNVESNNYCATMYSNCHYNYVPFCLTTKSNLTVTYNTSILNYQSTLNPLKECMSTHEKLLTQSNEVGNAIGQWLATHYICQEQKIKLDTVQLQSDMLTKTCRISELIKYDIKLLDANILGTQSKLDQATTCIKNQNTLYDSLPASKVKANPNSNIVLSNQTPSQDKRTVKYRPVVKNVHLYPNSVYVLGPYNTFPWGDIGWVNNWIDPTAQWIWRQYISYQKENIYWNFFRGRVTNEFHRDANIDTYNGHFVSLQKTFTSKTKENGFIHFILDNRGTVSFNKKIVYGSGTKVEIIEGINVIEVTLINDTGATGLLLSILDESGYVLVNTDGSWKWVDTETATAWSKVA